MNKSRSPQKVRVIRLDDLPVREAVPLARAPGDPPKPDHRPWPLPIGSAAAVAAGADKPLLRVVAQTATVPAPERLPEGLTGAAGCDEPALQHLKRGRVKAWPVRVWHEPGVFARFVGVQALLVCLSLGLYGPWAASRVRRFLWRHTRVVGRSLDDHESPWALAGHWAMTLGVLCGVALSWRASEAGGLLATSLAVLVWPLWLFMRLRQRAHHVSWARRRLGFAGRSSEVFRAVWPLVLGVLGLLWAGAAARHGARPVLWCAWGLCLAVWLMGLPLWAWSWLRWRQGQLRLGPWALWWTAPRAGMVSLFWRTLVWLALAGGLTLGLQMLGLGVLRWGRVPLGLAAHVLLLGLPAALWVVAVRAYVQARLQNLVWGKTGNRHVRFQSRLDVAAYVHMQCRHAALLLLTAGLYWPWALAATHRVRMQAVTVWSRVDADSLRAHWP
jgi:hypothetical protein